MELVEGVDFLRHVRSGDDETLRRSDEVTRQFGLGARADVVPDADAQPRGRFDEARLRAALEQLAHGLMALHRAGKVHRDIKPSNILVAPSGPRRPARLRSHRRRQRAPARDDLAGTVAFMAPEQGTTAPVTPAADWYSVGMLLYLALTGREPFAGPAARGADAQAHRRSAAAARAQRPWCRPTSTSSAWRCLQRSPSSRPNGRQVLRVAARARGPSARPSRRRRGCSSGARSRCAQLHAAFDEVRQRPGRLRAHRRRLGRRQDHAGAALPRRRARAQPRGAGAHAAAATSASRCPTRRSTRSSTRSAAFWPSSRATTSRRSCRTEIGLRGADLPGARPPSCRLRRRPRPGARPSERSASSATRGLQPRCARSCAASPRAARWSLHIDDLHWADEDSLLLLEALLRPTRRTAAPAGGDAAPGVGGRQPRRGGSARARGRAPPALCRRCRRTRRARLTSQLLLLSSRATPFEEADDRARSGRPSAVHRGAGAASSRRRQRRAVRRGSRRRCGRASRGCRRRAPAARSDRASPVDRSSRTWPPPPSISSGANSAASWRSCAPVTCCAPAARAAPIASRPTTIACARR